MKTLSTDKLQLFGLSAPAHEKQITSDSAMKSVGPNLTHAGKKNWLLTQAGKKNELLTQA